MSEHKDEPKEKSKIELLRDKFKVAKSSDVIYEEALEKVFDGLIQNKDNFKKQKPYLQILRKLLRVHPELEVFLLEP